MKRDTSVRSYETELEPIDLTLLENTRGGMDVANQAFLWGSVAGVVGDVAEHHFLRKVRV